MSKSHVSVGARPNACIPHFPQTGFLRLSSILAPNGPIPVGRSTWWAGVKEGRFPKARQAWPAHNRLAGGRHSRPHRKRRLTMARRHNVRRVKIHWSYSISEAAKLLGVHKLTVSRWIERGLPLIEQKRPFLIHGSDLRDFLTAQQPRKQPCRAGEIYCVRCRAPKRPAGDMADYIPKTLTTRAPHRYLPDLRVADLSHGQCCDARRCLCRFERHTPTPTATPNR